MRLAVCPTQLAVCEGWSLKTYGWCPPAFMYMCLLWVHSRNLRHGTFQIFYILIHAPEVRDLQHLDRTNQQRHSSEHYDTTTTNTGAFGFDNAC